MEYDEKTCVTAGELRASSVPVPADIPDCGWIPRGSIRFGSLKTCMEAPDYVHGIVRMTLPVVFTVPFRWIKIDMVFKDEVSDVIRHDDEIG